MMRNRNLFLALLLGPVAGLAGCAREEDPEGVIPEAYQESMNRAGNVEQQLQDAAGKRLEALDKGE